MQTLTSDLGNYVVHALNVYFLLGSDTQSP